ncbi:hypothetical protein EAF04_010279 [Stromatinia cepivora]|nr:hypothetical protein EAF04_010279 [Stromatinia cepivora]
MQTSPTGHLSNRQRIPTCNLTFMILAMASNLQCLEFESEDDFKEMMPACWEAFENPFSSYLRIVFYLEGTSSQERERSMQRAMTSVMMQHAQSASNSYWMKVIEPTYGKLVGAANWITWSY